MLDRLPLQGDEMVLDAGCGSGRVTPALHERATARRGDRRGRLPLDDRSRPREALGAERRGIRPPSLTALELDEPVDASSRTPSSTGSPTTTPCSRACRGAPARRPLVAQCGGEGNLDALPRAAPTRSRGAALRRVRGRLGGTVELRRPDATAATLVRAGFTDVRCWLEQRPVVPDEPPRLHPQRLPRPPPRAAPGGAARSSSAARPGAAAAQPPRSRTCGSTSPPRGRQRAASRSTARCRGRAVGHRSTADPQSSLDGARARSQTSSARGRSATGAHRCRRASMPSAVCGARRRPAAARRRGALLARGPEPCARHAGRWLRGFRRRPCEPVDRAAWPGSSERRGGASSGYDVCWYGSSLAGLGVTRLSRRAAARSCDRGGGRAAPCTRVTPRIRRRLRQPAASNASAPRTSACSDRGVAPLPASNGVCDLSRKLAYALRTARQRRRWRTAPSRSRRPRPAATRRRLPDAPVTRSRAVRRRIVTLPGDGIGPEIIGRRPRGCSTRSATSSSTSTPIGGASIDAHGSALTDEVLDRLPRRRRRAAGRRRRPEVGHDRPRARRAPSRACSACARASTCSRTCGRCGRCPALLDASPLRPERIEGTDLLVVRELTGGIYFGERGPRRRRAHDTCVYTVEEIERIARVGVQARAARAGDERGQGERARDLAPVARDRQARAPPTEFPDVRARAPARRQRRDAAGRRAPRSST